MQDPQTLRTVQGHFQPHPSHQRILLSQHYCLQIKQIFNHHHYHHFEKWQTFNHHRSQKWQIFNQNYHRIRLIFMHHLSKKLRIFYFGHFVHHRRQNQISLILFKSKFFSNPYCLELDHFFVADSFFIR